MTSVPNTTRRFECADVSSAVSRSASIGATFAALRAGNHAATNVTTTPMTIETTIVRGAITAPPMGRSRPNAFSTKRSPCAVAMPATTPIADANTPVKNASSRIDRITCLRFAPIARNSAVSLVRCATVIENVL